MENSWTEKRVLGRVDIICSNKAILLHDLKENQKYLEETVHTCQRKLFEIDKPLTPEERIATETLRDFAIRQHRYGDRTLNKQINLPEEF